MTMNRRSIFTTAFVGVFLVFSPSYAFAYVGPGAGLGMLGALMALVAGIVLAVGMTLLHPIKLLLKRMRGKNSDDEKATDKEPEDSENEKV